ncbi:phenylalanine--tRNA ligase subunit beta [Piscinibacter koreensis]|uniref:Phenylalanine--tRNA ligase beta subunit n=1 Tax=Piscinibacter koreensis TaxID=2742824 RepID=A0A7Y6NRY9_9BURK|nr:phenylalanine--tRNA ligase subunit beta [Schlegelella koreensis]NUZ08243.1 phenylalanine--tRNA ligase subunit beta [Schlegelella koreensis]
MQLPESWLREFCDPPIDTQALAHTLTMGGFEVEAMRPVAPPFHGVVVGEVLTADPHPNADRLRVCRVDVGLGELLDIVCGAPNVRAGIKVPCARVGAELPPAGDSTEPFRINLGKIRGVESAGMLCSARELQLADDHAGLLVLDDDAVVGADLRTQLRLDDTIFTLKLTPNLAHGLSVYGIARELAALTGAPLREPSIVPAAVTAGEGDRLPVRVEASDLCGRFSGRIIRDVDISRPTPAWMVDRLARCGQRSVSPLVDISNYVMFELGQPTHIFDLDRIHGGLTVRWGRPGESLELLNGSTVELDGDVGVIADAQMVESLAGIMGGAATAVSDATRNIYVEAAFWWPEAVAGRSRRYHFATDAGHRFERGVDPERTLDAIERISQLVLAICGTAETRCAPIDDQVLNLPARAPVQLRVARAAKVIGMPVTQAECEAVLVRLRLPFESADGVVRVTPPSWRFDLRIEEDLIEEVIRLIGYDRLPAGAPSAALHARAASETRRSSWALRHRLAGLGYLETINFSFVDDASETELADNAAPVRVLNPIASSMGVMRSTLLGSLLGVLRSNLARKATRVRVFELGKVFLRDAEASAGPGSVGGVRQPTRVGGLAFGPVDPLQWGAPARNVDFFDVKGDVETLLAPTVARFVPTRHPALHPGRSAAVEVDGRTIGVIGELHPRWRQRHELPGAAVLFELDVEALRAQPMPRHAALPRRQSAWRDLAVVAGPDVSHEALIETITSHPSGLIRSANLFDIYKPSAPVPDMAADERSLAVRLELLDDTTTLTDERIDAVVTDVLRTLGERLGVRLRR